MCFNQLYICLYVGTFVCSLFYVLKYVFLCLPMWALAHMGQAHMGSVPYGRIWARAHMGLGP